MCKLFMKSANARLSDAPECGVKEGKLLCFEGLNPDQAWNSTSVVWAACHLRNSSLKPGQVGSSKNREVFGSGGEVAGARALQACMVLSGWRGHACKQADSCYDCVISMWNILTAA